MTESPMQSPAYAVLRALSQRVTQAQMHSFIAPRREVKNFPGPNRTVLFAMIIAVIEYREGIVEQLVPRTIPCPTSPTQDDPMSKPAPLEEIDPTRRFPRFDMGSAAIGAVLGAGAMGLAAWITTSGSESVRAVRSPEGKIAISTTVATSPTSSEGGGEEAGYSDIEFLPNAVVVKRPDGSGRVFVNDRTIRFGWRLQTKSTPGSSEH